MRSHSRINGIVCALLASAMLGCNQRETSESHGVDISVSNNFVQIYQILRRGNVMPTNLAEYGLAENRAFAASIDPRLFVCPKTGNAPGDLKDIAKWSDFIYF